MASILITGGSGLIGQLLCKKLHADGHEISILSRGTRTIPNVKCFKWDYQKKQIEKAALQNVDVVIHLAGAGVADKRWTSSRKKEILDSRVQTAQLLYDHIIQMEQKPETYISASAVGFYGTHTSDSILNEEDLAGDDFLAKTCMQWEAMAKKFEDIGIRSAIIRTGVVLTKEGGALAKMVAPINKGVGSALGSGRQYLPWIHADDLCSIYAKAVENKMIRGIYNAVAPEHINNEEFTKELARVLKKSLFFPKVPSFVLKMLFGEMAIILLEGSRVSSDKILETKFRFKYPNVKEALNNLFLE